MTRDHLDITPLRSISPVCCNGNCNQGRACPLRERRNLPNGAGIVLAVAATLSVMALVALCLVLDWTRG